MPGWEDNPQVIPKHNMHLIHIRAQDLNTLTVLAFPYVIATTDALATAVKTFIK